MSAGRFVTELLAAQRLKAAEQTKKGAAAAGAEGDDAADASTAQTTATDVSDPLGKPVSKEAAIAQFQKAVSDAQAETKKAR